MGAPTDAATDTDLDRWPDLAGWRAHWPPDAALNRLPDAVLRTWLAAGRLRLFPPGSRLVDQGRGDAEVVLLLSGCVKISHSATARPDLLLAVALGGDIIGELTVLDGGPQPAAVTVSASTPTWACALTGGAFTDLLLTRPKALLEVAASISAKLRVATRQRYDLSRSTPVRLARLLVRLADRCGQPLDGPARLIPVELTQQEIGDLLGVSEPTAHRALKRLRDEGLLAAAVRRLVVPDPAALRTFATDPNCLVR
jgi:CRP/FNR family cyclic AMP-dependent transcriptional regulator